MGRKAHDQTRGLPKLKVLTVHETLRYFERFDRPRTR